VGLALLALTVAYGVLLQPPGCNQTAHYALVQSLADGSPRIDRFDAETCDTAYVDGHWYAAKSPGLALFTLPWFLALKGLGLVPRNDALPRGYPAAMVELPRRALWQVGLWGAVLPALVLVLLVALVSERLEPGLGLPAGVAFGLGTMVLPFATVLFAHGLAATLGFAAFAVLFFRRSPVAAGVLAGLAVAVDYPLAVLAVALALYAWRHVLPYALGAAVGLAPALAFSWWAFGTPFHPSYANAVLVPGESGHDVLGANAKGFFGIGTPSLRVALELLFSARGLLVLTPVVAICAAGLVLLWRRELRAEAALAGGVSAAYLVWNSGYYVPFGGFVPGPRFLIPALPLLALGLAPALRRWPLPTALLVLVSAGAMVVATAAEPLLGSDDTASWLRRWRHGDFAHSVVTLSTGDHGWLELAPFLAAAVLAAAIAATALPRLRVDLLAIAVVGAWLVVLTAAPDLLRTDRNVHQSWGLLALLVVVAALAVALLRPTVPHGAAAAVLLLLALPGFAAHTKQSLLVAAVALGAGLAVGRLDERRVPALDRRSPLGKRR
jgi:hypothetical protein